MNFNFEPLCCKNSSATLLLSKKYAMIEPIKTFDVIFGHET